MGQLRPGAVNQTHHIAFFTFSRQEESGGADFGLKFAICRPFLVTFTTHDSSEPNKKASCVETQLLECTLIAAYRRTLEIADHFTASNCAHRFEDFRIDVLGDTTNRTISQQDFNSIPLTR